MTPFEELLAEVKTYANRDISLDKPDHGYDDPYIASVHDDGIACGATLFARKLIVMMKGEY